MLKLEYTEVMGWEHAIRGMRNPMNSWEKSDSGDICSCEQKLDEGDRHIPYCLRHFYPRRDEVLIGPNDHALMMKLRNAGTDHRKFLRMITVYVDITAPLYWWKEFDTYKVGTVANSCSTMHKIHEKEFTLDDFSHELLLADTEEDHMEIDIPLIVDPNDFESVFGPTEVLNLTINMLNACRLKYLETWDARYFHQMIQLLPSSYNQKRTVMMNYEVLANIWKSRRNHKLGEWRNDICGWIKTLPYSELITGEAVNVADATERGEIPAFLGKKFNVKKEEDNAD